MPAESGDPSTVAAKQNSGCNSWHMDSQHRPAVGKENRLQVLSLSDQHIAKLLVQLLINAEQGRQQTMKSDLIT